MKILRVRLNHLDILTFMTRQWFNTAVVGGQCGFAIDDFLRLNCHVMVCEVIRGQLIYIQKHNAHT